MKSVTKERWPAAGFVLQGTGTHGLRLCPGGRKLGRKGRGNVLPFFTVVPGGLS